ncbi:MAG: N-acetylneuraminate synthase family protein [Thermoanaerobaculia bacterium]|nr:N-acetylneuraminate synthase family protein [Thermoanaerobaculia bacterium]
MTKIPSISIAGRRVSEEDPCFVIAEAGVNHNGSLDMALQLVDVAADAGADAVKFQKRDISSLYPTELLDDPNKAEWAFQYLLPILKQSELEIDAFAEIKKRCQERGIMFLCTPWDARSFEQLEELDIPAFKVSSADLINLPLLETLAATGKPLILSTGMATQHEIEVSVDHLKKLGTDFALLHCVSTYPAPFESLNLRFMATLRDFGVPVGYSSHERGIAIPLLALGLGACIIEKHLTLDRTLPGPDHPASLEPSGLSKLIRDIRHAEIALGKPEKLLSAMERLNRQLLRKSLVAAQDLASGTVVTKDMVSVKGPGKGLSPQQIGDLLGTKLSRTVKKEDFFTLNDLTGGKKTALDTSMLVRPWGFKARFHDLAEILENKPPLVELHFSDDDVDHPFEAPKVPHPQRLFVHAPEFSGSRLLDLCSEKDEVREIAIDFLQRTIDKTVALAPSFTGGTPGVVIHVGGMSMDEPVQNRDLLMRRAIDSLSRIDPKGLDLLPENLPPRPWYLGGQWFQNLFIRPEEMVEFCAATRLGMTLDISHAQLYCNYSESSLLSFVELCLPQVKHLHLADAQGVDGEGLQIGDGVVDWDTILQKLSEKDFTWVPEIWSGHQNEAAGFLEAIERLAAFDVL